MRDSNLRDGLSGSASGVRCQSPTPNAFQKTPPQHWNDPRSLLCVLGFPSESYSTNGAEKQEPTIP